MEKLIVPRARRYKFAPVYWIAISQTGPGVRKIYGEALSIQYTFFVNRRNSTILPKREFGQIGVRIADRLISETGYFENIERETAAARQRILAFLREIKKVDLAALSFTDLLGWARRIYELFIGYDTASVFAWFVAGDALRERVGTRLGLSGEELGVLALPTESTFATQMERAVLEAALGGRPAGKIARELTKEYYWIPFGYDGPAIWDREHFAGQIREHREDLKGAKAKLSRMVKQDLARKQGAEKLVAARKFGVDDKRLMYILRTVTLWTDERKMLEFPLFFHYRRILSELGCRFNVPVDNLKYLFMHELARLATGSQALRKLAEQRMKRELMIITEGGKARIATDEEMHKVKQMIEQQAGSRGSLRGSVACRGPKGKYTARVKVLQSPEECHKVSPGEMLVVAMTSPEYVLAMNQALGFITNEGGVTCHAAIIAREMNKPCIIGTGNATEVLKDGDKVSLDVAKGVVRVIK